MKKIYPVIGALSLGAALIAGNGGNTVTASSHREAPSIAEDQYVDNTDVYAFISPQSADRMVIVADYVPLLIPASGPNFYKFSTDAYYEMHVDNNGDAKEDITLTPSVVCTPPTPSRSNTCRSTKNGSSRGPANDVTPCAVVTACSATCS